MLHFLLVRGKRHGSEASVVVSRRLHKVAPFVPRDPCNGELRHLRLGPDDAAGCVLLVVNEAQGYDRNLGLLGGRLAFYAASLFAWNKRTIVMSGLRATGRNRKGYHKNLVNSSIPESALMAGLSDDTVRTLMAAAQIRHVGPNVMLIAEAEQANHLFLIKTGNMRFYRVTRTGEEITLLSLVPGDIVGLGSLLAGHTTYMVNAETTSPCELLVWSRAEIRRFRVVYPKILENGLEVSSEYLRTAPQRHADLATELPEIRIARSLLRLADKIGRVHSSGIEIEVSNETLSSLSDVSRFTASRILAGWARTGKVSKQRGRVTLHAPDALIE